MSQWDNSAGAGSGGAGDLDEQAAPARHLGPPHANRPRGGASPLRRPRREPLLDLGREVAGGLAAREVDPDTGVVVDGRVGDEEEFVAVVEVVEELRSFTEDGAVHGGAEAGRLIGRQRRRNGRIHGGLRATGGGWRSRGNVRGSR